MMASRLLPPTTVHVFEDGPTDRFLSRDDSLALAQRAAGYAARGGTTVLDLTTEWTGNLRWARNAVRTSGDVRNDTIAITRTIRGARGTSATNRTDPAYIEATVRRAERLSIGEVEDPEWDFIPRRDVFAVTPYANPKLFFDATYRQSGAERAELMRRVIRPAAVAGMLSTGYLQVRAAAGAVLGNDSVPLYFPYTQAQYSVTVRDPAGSASGWAGVDYGDWTRIDADALSSRALEKCLRARNPVALEPGRYTAILEPQAVGDLVAPIFGDPLVMDFARAMNESENYPLPFSGRAPHRTRVGEPVIDQRLTVSTDPMDPDLGYFPVNLTGPYRLEVNRAFRPIERGVLTTLAYSHFSAAQYFLKSEALPWPRAFRLTGSPETATGAQSSTSIEEMIATTTRGLLVTRFSGVDIVDTPSTTCSGYTRDGLWLVESGKVSRPVKNFRFVQSVLSALNKVDQIGASVRIFHPEFPVVVPPLKVRDFNFVALSEAV